MQDCWFESSVTFTVDNSTFINKHSLIYCKGLLIHKRSVGTKQINLMVNVDKRDLARPNHKKLWNPFHLNALERRVVKMFRSSKKIKMHFNSLFSNYFFFYIKYSNFVFHLRNNAMQDSWLETSFGVSSLVGVNWPKIQLLSTTSFPKQFSNKFLNSFPINSHLINDANNLTNSLISTNSLILIAERLATSIVESEIGQHL